MSRSSAIITIGNEILLGKTLNTNLAWLAHEMAVLGIPVSYAVVVKDEREQILQALNDVWGKYDVVFTTGGLGPTADDITKAAIAEFFGKELVFEPSVWEHVQSLFSRRNVDVPESNRGQALVPEEFTALRNEMGTAPGLFYQDTRGVFAALQGVPLEMKHVFSMQLLPKLQEIFPDALPIFQKTLHSFRIAESALAEIISPMDISPLVNLAWLPQTGRVDLRLYGEDQELVLQAEQIVRRRLGSLIWGSDEDTPALVLYSALKERGMSIAVVESCTGGLIQNYLTEVGGISEVFRGGMTSYHNELKVTIAGVNPDTLDHEGAVSEAVARQMAMGVQKAFSSDVSIAVTGIAGPTGGSPDKPVGLVWFAYCVHEAVFSEHLVFNGDRNSIRHKAAEAAILRMTRLLIEDKS